MRIKPTLRASALILVATALAGCGKDDLTVAVAENVAGESMGVADVQDAPASAPVVDGEAEAPEPPTSAIPEPDAATEPEAEQHTAPASALEAAAAEAAAKRAAAEAEDAISAGAMAGIGDLGNSDEQPALPPVEEPEAPPAEVNPDDLDTEGAEEEVGGGILSGEEWTPPPIEEPKLEDGIWHVTFDYLGSFDTGMLALPEDSPLAIEARREQQMLAEKSDSPPTGLPPESDDIPIAPPTEVGFPDIVRKMDGGVVRIEGYMIPLKFDDGKVTSFFLSRYMMGCCFGVLPKANEIIEVEMAEGKGAFYDAYMPFVVQGKFVIVEEGTDPEYMQSVFRMTADSCDYSEDW